METEKQHHTQLTREDCHGNDKIGRIFFVPGSRARAETISQFFTRITKIITNDRDLTYYLGEIDTEHGPVAVGAGPSGMGDGSAEIVCGELLAAGVKTMIRVGTGGTLQREIGFGDLVITTGAVRDEKASWDYAPSEFPAIAHYTVVVALARAAITLGLVGKTFLGLTHSKSSLWAREGGADCPNQEENLAYKRKLTRGRILDSEMEISVLLIQALCRQPIMSLKDLLANPEQEIKVGCICVIVNDFPKPRAETDEKEQEELFSQEKESLMVIAQEQACRVAIQGAVELCAILTGQKPIF